MTLMHNGGTDSACSLFPFGERVGVRGLEIGDRSLRDRNLHGHFTTILFAYSEPMVSVGSLWSAPSWLSRADKSAFIWSGFTTESLHRAGAPTSLAGLFSAKLKSTKNSRSKTSIVSSLAFTGALSGSTKWSVSTVSLGSNSR